MNSEPVILQVLSAIFVGGVIAIPIIAVLCIFSKKVRRYTAATIGATIIFFMIVGAICTPPVGWIILAYAYTNGKRPDREDKANQNRNTILVDVATRL